MRQAFGERLPLISAAATTIDTQLAFRHEVFRIALDGHNIDRVGFVCVNVDYEAKVSGDVPAHFFPGIAGIVAAHDVPVLLHKEHVWTLRVHGHVVNAVPNFRFRIGNVLGMESLVGRFPRLAAIIRAKRSGRRDRDKYPFGIAGIKNDRVQTHSACPRLPFWSCAMAAQAGQLVP